MEYLITTCILVGLIAVFEARDGKRRAANLNALHEMKRGAIMVVNIAPSKKVRKHAISALLMISAISASASPYFRIADPRHPIVNAGTWVDVVGNTDYGSSVALITHSSRDGSIFKSIQSDWVLLGLGGGYGNGSAFMALGPSANLSPLLKSSLLGVLDIVAPNSFSNVRQLLAPVPGTAPDINISFGPQFSFRPIEGGTCLSADRWKGRITFFAGGSWVF